MVRMKAVFSLEEVLALSSVHMAWLLNIADHTATPHALAPPSSFIYVHVPVLVIIQRFLLKVAYNNIIRICI